jgi:hypothetical protein
MAQRRHEEKMYQEQQKMDCMKRWCKKWEHVQGSNCPNRNTERDSGCR